MSEASSAAASLIDKESNYSVLWCTSGLLFRKLLAETFLVNSAKGSVNLIIVDIRGDLEPQLLKDLRFSVYDVKFPYVRFYKANLADVEGTKKLWAKIVDENGPIHILVNNHAICNGKLIEEMTIE